MANMNKLRGKIVENGLSVEILAERIGIDKTTFYRKIAQGGRTFTIKEANDIARELHLSMDDCVAIFFSLDVT